MSANIDEKRQFIREKLENEFNLQQKLIELDFEYNLLLTAAQSYKHETILKPFPSLFVNSNQQKYDNLVSIFDLFRQIFVNLTFFLFFFLQ